MKRTFDFILALSGLFTSLPIWFIIGLAIWLEDRGPVFYIQDRVGKNGRIFKSIKFRSMVHDAEKELGPIQAKEYDPRFTNIGKILRITAMDELPQLLNILKADMSFVGPRALRPVEIEIEDGKPRKIWEIEGFKERSQVTPGLTGITQIFAPRDIARSEKFKYDIWYIKHQNLSLDIYLIVLSFLITFRAKWETRKDKFSSLARRLNSKIEKEIG